VRVVLIHHAAPPVVGGVERVLGQHARLMADAGHTVTIVAGRGTKAETGVGFLHMPLVDTQHPSVTELGVALAAGRVPPSFGRIRDRLVADLRAVVEWADVVIAHNVGSLNKNLALTAALHQLSQAESAPAFALWHHDLAWTLPHYRASLHDGPPWDLLRTAWPGVTQVAISQVRRRQLASLTGLAEDAITVVPNGIDVAAMLRLDRRTRTILRRTRLLDTEPLLLMPARILPRKNIELGLRVVAALRAMGHRAGLVVTGPGDPHDPDALAYRSSLLELRDALEIGDAVWFLGADHEEGLPDEVVADLYALADVLFLPSREEGFGIPVLEALLRRTPIVCSELPALREVAGDAATYIDPDAPPEAVAQRIVDRVTDDAPARRSMRIRRDSSWEEVGRRHVLPLLRRIEEGTAGDDHPPVATPGRST